MSSRNECCTESFSQFKGENTVEKTPDESQKKMTNSEPPVGNCFSWLLRETIIVEVGTRAEAGRDRWQTPRDVLYWTGL